MKINIVVLTASLILLILIIINIIIEPNIKSIFGVIIISLPMWIFTLIDIKYKLLSYHRIEIKL